MTNDQDAGLIKRGLVLLIVMLLLVSTVLFIMFQGRRPTDAPPPVRAEDYAWNVALPGAPFPASVSWGALVSLSEYTASSPGWEVRHNAVATLARRGSDHVPWSQVQEMLDLRRTTANVRVQAPDAKEAPEPTARAMVIAALKATAEWHKTRQAAGKTSVPAELHAVYEMVDALANSPIMEIRDQAKKTQATFFRS